MAKHACEHCESCCNISVGHEEHEEEKPSTFKAHFWKFLMAAGTLLGLSILIEFSLLATGSGLSDLVLSQCFAIGAVILSCHDVFLAALSEMRQKRLGASTLMVVAAIGSFLILHAQEGAMAIWLYSIAEKLEDLSADRARDAVSKLVALAPDMALRKVDGQVQQVPTRDVKVGDIIVIKPGMKVPLDGKVVAGESYFDTHAITGESVPRLKAIGDDVFASSINGDMLVELQVTKASGDTLLAKITDSIRTAQKNKSKTEIFIQKFARYYTPAIFLVSLAIMILPWLVFNQEPLPWIYRALILLVISCPCALTLSTPLSMVAALTKLSREGVLVKGGRYIEALDKITMFGFDKTATLTEGRLKVHDIVPMDGDETPAQVLQIIASLEANSQHPIAKAIVSSARDVTLLPVTGFAEVKGKGITGKIHGIEYRAGSLPYITGLGIDVPESRIKEYTSAGKTPVLLSRGNDYIGMVTIRDNLRVSAPILLRGLKNRRIKSMIISGDNQATVDSIGDCLYVDERYGNLLPEQKLDRIKQVQARGQRVSMVGDGINDAPALTQSNVGIAMGSSGTDIALEAADITIMNDDLTKILVLLDIKRIANRIVRQNIWLSIIIKISFAILTVLGFMNLAIAVGIGDMGVSLLVILNGFRVFGYKSKFQDVSAEDLEVEATRIICKTCKTTSVYPQHHGREMVEKDGQLVCWKSLVAEVSADACKVKLSLACPTCNGMREIE
ncbi:MAG: cation-translocating P-type ATPase [Candidatus Lokiarchaeota archaeon]|nr:cation-translocating P-type ATPase [Candidatus Lokiarchaeota archaeon]